MSQSPSPMVIDADALTGEMHPIRRAVISIGSNLGDRLAHLQGAVDTLADTPDVFITGISSVYETAPVDAPAGSEDFLNVVVLLDTTLPVHTLLDRALAIESAFGRQRDGVANSPRELDIDLIVVGDRRCNDESLTLPHPRAQSRAFVLIPWLELEADAELPDAGPVAALLEGLSADQPVTRREDLEIDLR